MRQIMSVGIIELNLSDCVCIRKITDITKVTEKFNRISVVVH